MKLADILVEIEPNFFTLTTFVTISKFSRVGKVTLSFFIVITKEADIVSTLIKVGEGFTKAILFVELELSFVIFNISLDKLICIRLVCCR